MVDYKKVIKDTLKREREELREEYKKLIIREKKHCFHVTAHEDASPLILGKKIIN